MKKKRAPRPARLVRSVPARAPRARAQTFRVVFSRDVEHYDVSEASRENWLVRLEGVDGVHTFGRSLALARRNIRYALAAAIGKRAAARAVFDERIELPVETVDLVARARNMSAIARAALTDLHLSERDARAVLDDVPFECFSRGD